MSRVITFFTCRWWHQKWFWCLQEETGNDQLPPNLSSHWKVHLALSGVPVGLKRNKHRESLLTRHLAAWHKNQLLSGHRHAPAPRCSEQPLPARYALIRWLPVSLNTIYRIAGLIVAFTYRNYTEKIINVCIRISTASITFQIKTSLAINFHCRMIPRFSEIFPSAHRDNFPCYTYI